MATPEKFSPPYNFQSELGDAFGLHLDNSFNQISRSISSVVDLLMLLARTDGRLANSTVHLQSLTDELKKFIQGQLGNWKLTGPWVANRRYKYGDIVEWEGAPYGCHQDHVAGANFLDDYQVYQYWQMLGGDTGLFATVAYVDTSIQALSDYLQGSLSPFETIEHAEETYAPKISPVFTGDPKAPTVALNYALKDVLVNLETLLSIFTTRNRWRRAQDVDQIVLPYQSSILTDCSQSNIFHITMTGNATLENPINAAAGGTYIWHIDQGGSGNNLMVYGTRFVSSGGSSLALSTHQGAKDTLTAVFDGSLFRCALSKDFR